MIGIEGRIEVRLCVDGGTVRAVRIRSRRPTRACAALCGRAAQDAISFLPLLFSICGTAQTHAGLSACENALEIAVSPAQRAARRLLLLAETANAHGWRIFLDWPPMAGEEPELEPFVDLRSSLQRMTPNLYPGKNWAILGGAPLQPDGAALSATISDLAGILARAIIGDPSADLPPWGDAKEFKRWCTSGPTPTARAFAAVLEQGMATFGRSEIGGLPEIDAASLDAVLAADTDGAFAEAPAWHGKACETGPLSRLRRHPVVAALLDEHGNGLLPRMVARLVEILTLPDRMTAMIPDLADDAGDGVDVQRDGTGLAAIEMARGRLVHRVEVAGGTVTRYQIVAPTEWNFHPQGPLAAGLRGIREADADRLRSQAAMLVTAFDPCVACDVVIE